jgi:UDP-glucuronate 4-epimerase
MRVLVTGGAGLIGIALRALLRDHGHEVVAIDRTRFGRDDPALQEVSMEDAHSLHALARQHAFDGIAHCGAISGPMMAKGRPMEIVSANLLGTANVLELARVAGVPRVVFCSSISVYGNAGEAVLTEDRQPHPSSVYAASKAAGEQLVEAYATEYGGDGVSLRIGRVYGPYRRADCILKTIIEDAQAGRTTFIPGTADFLYHYVWVGDVARAILAALIAPRLVSRVYNVGSGEAATMPEIIAIAGEKIRGLDARLVPGADDVPDMHGSFPVARIAAELGFRPEFDLARGIAAYAAALPEPAAIR